MNTVISTIMNRHSVRFYTQQPISDKIIDSIIACGNAAPSGAGNRGWRFVVVTDPAFRKRLAELALPRYKAWLAGMPDQFKALRAPIDAANPDPAYYGAPVIVFVVGRGMTSDLDCAMVCENMMIAAKSYNIGSCWSYIGQLVLDAPEVKEKLEQQQDEKVYGPILFGYAAPGGPEPSKAPEPVVKRV